VPIVHAVTMTGEMADLFPDRRHGVRAIIDLLVERLERGRGDRLLIYAGAQGFVAPADGRQDPDAIGSANWIATAQWCARGAPSGILLDVGSTTTDLIPFAGGRVAALGATDATRLEHGELAYVGIVRTPVMGMGERAPVDGRWRPTIKEYYATTADVFRMLQQLDESCDVQDTADNGPKTPEASARRLLRAIGEDLTPATWRNAVDLARWYRERMLQEIVDTLHLRLSRGDIAPDAALIGAGIGRFLVDEIGARVGRAARAIDDLLCPPGCDASLRSWAAHCAPAVAVALLAHADA